MSSFTYNKIYFLVSDSRMNRIKDFFNTVSYRCTEKKMDAEYLEAKTKDKFKEGLRKIEEETKSQGVLPYIHIECHGNKYGLILESKAKIGWSVLNKYFIDINIASKNNLFISFASCQGGFVSLSLIETMVKSKKRRAPFFGIVGPTGEISYGEIEEGFELYFEELIETQSASRALERLGSAIENSAPYILYTCEQMFVDFVENMIDLDLQRKFRSQLSFNNHVMDLLFQRFRTTGELPNPVDFDSLSKIMTDHDFYINFFNDIREVFLMLDLFPQNESRFRKLGGINNWDKLLRNINLKRDPGQKPGP